MEYAVVDIETTGAFAKGNRITEIAIYIFDGHTILQHWQTLINPQREIAPAITALTGIDDNLVTDAPTFDEVALKVFEMLSGRIFVAHNVNFDYTFIKDGLARAGFEWSAKKLCTMRAARLIFPGLGSYSLGRLCKSLDLPARPLHRAANDALAALEILMRILSEDRDAKIQSMLRRGSEQRLPPNLPPEDFSILPDAPGVYYFLDRTATILYIGKAKNIRKRVASHFSGQNTSERRQAFLREIHKIRFDICATELMALVMECAKIQQHWPRYNTALKRFEPRFGLFEYESRSGHLHLAVGRVRNQPTLRRFHTMADAVGLLRQLADQHGLDHRLCHYGPQDRINFVDALPDRELHNELVRKIRNIATENLPSYLLIDKGIESGQASCFLIENGIFYGMGYLADDGRFTKDEVKPKLTPYKSNKYLVELIDRHARANPDRVIALD